MGSAQNQKLRSLTSDKEIPHEQLYRDTRRPMEKVRDTLADSPGLASAIVLMLLPMAAVSTTFFVVVITPILFWVVGCVKSKEQTLPIYLPTEANIKDLNDPKPGRRGFNKASGEFLMGNLRLAKRAYEIWLTFNYLCMHQLIIGTTGSGKSETIVSQIANFIASGSSASLIDPKAGPKLGWQIFTLARFFGREDDFRTLNYIKGNTNKKLDRAMRRGHCANLFAFGSSESITQLLVSLMPPGGSENKLFSERAISLVSATMPALVDLRDNAGLKINPGVLRKAMEFKELEKLKRAKPISPESREAIRAYLSSLSGYQENPVDRQGNPTDKQDSEVYRQHGFAQAYFTRALSTLSDSYADIYMVGRGEVNFLDLILRRRILVVLIPALEKAPEEMKNLGKLVLAGQKNAVSTGLPPYIEGEKTEVLDALPTNAPIPFGLYIDEAAFVLIEGIGALFAQARSLGVACTVAGQDVAGMKKENANEAEQIFENTKTKTIMASEGLGETRKLIEEIAGEGITAVTAGYQMDEGGLFGNYIDNRSASFEKRERVSSQDTRSALVGEGFVFWRDKVIPWQSFYHGLDEESIISDFQILRLPDVGEPTRGPGFKLLLNDSPLVTAIKDAVTKGHDLGLENSNVIPQFSLDGSHPLGEAKFDLAMGQWRQVLSHLKRTKEKPAELPDNHLVASEGLFIAALSIQHDQTAVEDLRDSEDSLDLMPTTQDRDEEQANLDASSLFDTVSTLDDTQWPDSSMELDGLSASLNDVSDSLDILNSPRRNVHAEQGDSSHSRRAEVVKSVMAGKEDSSVTDGLEKQVETEEAPSVQETLEALAGYQSSESESPDAEIPKEPPTLVGEPTKASSLLSGKEWVLDPNRLAERVQRPIHPAEIEIAARGGDYAGRIERALGTSLEESRRVSEETAVAIAKSIGYPKHIDSVPAKLESQEEQQVVIQDSSRTVRNMRAWLKGS